MNYSYMILLIKLLSINKDIVILSIYLVSFIIELKHDTL